MILEFVPGNLLKVVNATPEEMGSLMALQTAEVNRFKRGNANWDGSVKFYWYVPSTDKEEIDNGIFGYYYVPSACWKRIAELRKADEKTYRPAYDVQFRNREIFFNEDIELEQVTDFAYNLEPENIKPYPFDDISEQIIVLYSMLVYNMSSHHIATGFGKTYLAFMLAQYTRFVYEGRTLIIVPRTDLVTQGIGDFLGYQGHLEDEQKLNVYGIAGGVNNYCSLDNADVILGTYQSLVNMPDDLFKSFHTVLCDEGHTSKAQSVKDTVCRCVNAKIITAISGTMKYGDPVDLLTIESYCGPLISDYPVSSQISKGRLPKIEIQPIELIHGTDQKINFDALLAAERLPVPYSGHPTELATKYRALEFRFLGQSKPMLDYILKLCEQYTKIGKNILVVFTNQQPSINLFEYALEKGIKAHLIFGGTPKNIRNGIKYEIEHNGGYILVATSGTMAMGVSINNLHGCVSCMDGHSPHVILQIIGRMLRNHEDKFPITVVYDVYNNISAFGTKFDLRNNSARRGHYKTENYPVLKTEKRHI